MDTMVLTYVKAKDNFDRSAIPPAGPNPLLKFLISGKKIWTVE